jgi:hypothetical protein
VLDELLVTIPVNAGPATAQIWPEHFDLGTNFGLRNGHRVNVGFSPGDAYEPAPYLYVGPSATERRGHTGYWNAPFGAVLREVDIEPDDPRGATLDFLRRGVEYASDP